MLSNPHRAYQRFLADMKQIADTLQITGQGSTFEFLNGVAEDQPIDLRGAENPGNKIGKRLFKHGVICRFATAIFAQNTVLSVATSWLTNFYLRISLAPNVPAWYSSGLPLLHPLRMRGG